MANGYSIFVGLIIIAAMCGAAWFFAPKGENQVYVSSYSIPRKFILTIAPVPQTLAIIPHPHLRQLLPDVGNHIPRSTAPPYRAETVRAAKGVCTSLKLGRPREKELDGMEMISWWNRC
jgi:hypothetical protein